jgi:enterochelin esterase-like enzyme
MSMGGGQTLNIGLATPDTFAWIAAVAAAPNTRLPADLSTDPAALQQLKLLWLSVGNRDTLFRVSKGLHDDLIEKGAPKSCTHRSPFDGGAHARSPSRFSSTAMDSPGKWISRLSQQTSGSDASRSR